MSRQLFVDNQDFEKCVGLHDSRKGEPVFSSQCASDTVEELEPIAATTGSLEALCDLAELPESVILPEALEVNVGCPL